MISDVHQKGKISHPFRITELWNFHPFFPHKIGQFSSQLVNSLQHLYLTSALRNNITNRHGYPSLQTYAEIDDDIILLHAQSSQFL